MANFGAGTTYAIGSTHCHYAIRFWLHCTASMKQTFIPLKSSYCQFVQLCVCSTERTLVSVYFALVMHVESIRNCHTHVGYVHQCLHKREPCGFSTFFNISVATNVTARVTSQTNFQ